MKVNVRYLCHEIVGNISGGEMDIPEGSTVRDMMKIAADRSGTFVYNYMDLTSYMVNMRGASPDMVLKDGDSVMVLRITYGG